MLTRTNNLIDDAVQMLTGFIEDLEIDEVNGMAKLRHKPLARFLMIDPKSIRKLKASLLRGDQQTTVELQALSVSGFGREDQQDDKGYVTDAQIGWLAQYYSKNDRVSQETRDHCSRLCAAFMAIGVRAIAYRAKGYNLDWTPVSYKPRKIALSELSQFAYSQTKIGPVVEEALVESGYDFFAQVRVNKVLSICHQGYQKLDFYLPDIGPEGVAIKTYFQQGSGTGYQRLSVFKDEILYRYPCPAIMVISGDFMMDNKHATILKEWMYNFQSPGGKLRQVLCCREEDLKSNLKDLLFNMSGEERRASKFDPVKNSGRKLHAA